MEIRSLRTDELDILREIATKFFASSEHLKDFDMEVFKKNWTQFIDAGIGIIYGLFEGDKICGTIGGFCYPDVNSGLLSATELFWFVLPEQRGKGLLLLDAFETWAKSKECKRIIMVHLTDLMPEKVKRIYDKRGYKPIEIHYMKEII